MNYIEERIYYPDGCDPEHVSASLFAVKVAWRGGDRWAVYHVTIERPFTHTGRLLWYPPRVVQMRWCRFDFEDACALAERVVDGVKINGRTWAEWEAWREQRRAQ